MDTLSVSGASSATANTARSGLTYKKLSDNVFFWTALIMHLTVIVLALTVESIDSIFELSGAIGASATIFLFPGIAYLVALSRYGSNRIRQKWETSFYKMMAWMFLLLQAVVLGLYFYLKIQQARGVFTSEDED